MSDPTQSELAALAAKLSTGQETTVEDFRWLAERALNLWHGAGEALEERRSEQELHDYYANLPDDIAFRDAGLEPPKQVRNFKLNESLKFLMPNRRPADRMKAFRDYLTQTDFMFLFWGLDPQDAEEIPTDEQIQRIRESGLHYHSLMRIAEHFLPWLESHIKSKRSEAGRAGGRVKKPARKKAAKKKREL